MTGIFDIDDNHDAKRTLGIRDKQILYRNANKCCENPACRKQIDFDEMQVGHKNAWSRGGSTTLKNSVCLCYRCNKLQGTDNWSTFLKKQHVVDNKTEMKQKLSYLSIGKLKILAKKHNISVKGKVDDDIFFGSTEQKPSKKQYISKLSVIVSDSEINSVPEKTRKIKKRKRKQSDDFWPF